MGDKIFVFSFLLFLPLAKAGLNFFISQQESFRVLGKRTFSFIMYMLVICEILYWQVSWRSWLTLEMEALMMSHNILWYLYHPTYKNSVLYG